MRGALLPGVPSRGPLARVRVAGHLHRRGELPVRRGILVREGQEPIGERQAGLVRPGVQIRVLDVFGRPIERAATIATSDAPRLAATADALPPPGTGAAEPSSPMNASRLRSRKRSTASAPRTDCTVASRVR